MGCRDGFGVISIGRVRTLALEGPRFGDMGFESLSPAEIPTGVLGTVLAAPCQVESTGVRVAVP